VRPDCAGLGYFHSLCIAGGRLCRWFLAARSRCFLARLGFHFVYPPSSRLERPPGNSGNIRQELTDVLDCLSGKVTMNTS
jgi:hypothetical protein